jgi:hypothetical protein
MVGRLFGSVFKVTAAVAMVGVDIWALFGSHSA